MKVVAFDTECRGLDWFRDDQQPFMYTWFDGNGACASIATEDEPDEIAEFVHAMKSADVIVAHNLPYDTHQVREELGLDVLDLGAELVDTAMLSRVVNPSGRERQKHGLKDLAEQFLHADAKDAEDAIKAAAKDAGLRTLKADGAYYKVWKHNPDAMEHYAAMDAVYTYELYEMFSRRLNGQQAVFDLEMDVMPILIRAEERGVRIDQQKVCALENEYKTRMLEAEQWLHAELGDEIDDGDLAEKLLALGVPLNRRTNTGTLSTAAFALQDHEDDHEVVRQLQEWRRMRKFLSTYIGALKDVDVVHPSFWQLGAWTGRMSCSRPNLQNIPKRAGKEVRECFVPRDEHSFVVLDYEAIEIRLLAYYLGDAGYRQLIEDGHDPHAWMAAQIHGGEPKDYAKGTPGEGQRNIAKNTLFAVVYGAGARRVADMNKMEPSEAKALISKIKSSIPNWWNLQDRIKAKVAEHGHVSTIIGRKQLIPKDKAYIGLNGLIQGSAADIFKMGVVAAAEAVAKYDGRLVMFVHDEIVCEVPTENAADCQVAMEQAMVSPSISLGLRPALAVEGSITDKSYGHA